MICKATLKTWVHKELQPTYQNITASLLTYFYTQESQRTTWPEFIERPIEYSSRKLGSTMRILEGNNKLTYKLFNASESLSFLENDLGLILKALEKRNIIKRPNPASGKNCFFGLSKEGHDLLVSFSRIEAIGKESIEKLISFLEKENEERLQHKYFLGQEEISEEVYNAIKEVDSNRLSLEKDTLLSHIESVKVYLNETKE